MSLIESFVATYKREVDFYDRLASICEIQCRAACEAAGIKAIFSHRAKTPEKLQEKLLKRQTDEGRVYASVEKIRDDIFDLAGARIALYFPGDYARVEQLIRQNFVLLEQKEPKSEPGRYRFPGYRAFHYRIQLHEEMTRGLSRYYSGEMIEIQVASVFMHAWAEVEHDLSYKNSTGDQLSDSEYQILDQLNGLAHAGELALNQLEKAMLARASRIDQQFRNHYEFTAFVLDEILKKYPDQALHKTGEMDVLFDFLRYAGLHSSESVRRLVDGVSLRDDLPIAGLISDQLLKERPELERWYRQARFRSVNPPPDYYNVEQDVCELKNLLRSCLIKGSGDVLYWYAKDGTRLVIPNKQTFDTWYPASGPKPVVKQLRDEDLVKIMISGNVTYRPGTRLIKIATDQKIYAIGHGGVIRWLANDQTAEELFGYSWKETLVDTIADTFFVNYSVGYRIDAKHDYNPERERVASQTIDEDRSPTRLPVSVPQPIRKEEAS